MRRRQALLRSISWRRSTKRSRPTRSIALRSSRLSTSTLRGRQRTSSGRSSVPFVHEDRDAFVELVERVAARLDRDRFMIEKDYWVTHALYALHSAGFTTWFKGGTSLSKGFSLIDR